jgi:cytoskeleton protein RodZ
MKEIGVRFKKARESKGLTINEVSVATKINPKVLVALEEADLNKLPPKSFLRGFVRTYSVYLKLDTDDILKIFSEELGTTVYTTMGQQSKDSESPVAPVVAAVIPAVNKVEAAVKSTVSNTVSNIADAMPKKLEFPIPPIKAGPKVYVAIGIVALIVVVFLLKGIVDKYEKERVVEPITLDKTEAAPADSSLATTTTESTNSTTTATAAPTSTATTTPASATASTSTTTSAPASAVAAPVATPPATSQSAAPQTPATSTATTSEQGTQAKPKAAQQNVIVEALDKVTLAIRIDDGQTQRITLSPDQVHTISGQGLIFVDVSDGGAVNIIHNGKEKGVPGDLGKPIKIRFP